MTSSRPAGTFTDVFRAGTPAVVVALALGVALRFTGISRGARVGATFFVFMVLHNLFFDRIVGTQRTARWWVVNIGVATLAAALMWWIAEA